MSRLPILCLVLIGLLGFVAPAKADWLRAETDRFIIYSEGGEGELRREAERLHRFDRLIRTPFGLSMEPPPRPLTIFLVNGRAGLESLYPAVGSGTAGYYSATEHEVYAALNRRQHSGVLLHEYVHHVMRQNFPIATPAWFTEGVAEFYSTAQITDRETRVGSRLDGRIATLNRLPWISTEQLLTGRTRDGSREQRAAFYAQAWLLTHWLLSDPQRLKQLEAYLQAVAAGTPSLEALQTHIGLSPEALETELKAYRSRMVFAVYPTPETEATKMTITRLPPSANALLPISVNMTFPQRGPEAEARYAEARAQAARWPEDRLGRLVLAKVELASGTPVAAEPSLDALLTADSADVEALRLYARLRVFQADAAETAGNVEERDRLHRQARAFLARALAADPNDYRIYLALARSRRIAADYPNANDLETWRLAVELAPQVYALRWEAAEAFARAGQPDIAADLIAPLANDPHGGPQVDRARERLRQLRPGSVDEAPADIAPDRRAG